MRKIDTGDLVSIVRDSRNCTYRSRAKRENITFIVYLLINAYEFVRATLSLADGILLECTLEYEY